MAIDPDSGIVFNIQRCSIHDGPGVRTTVFLKGCPLRCFWCQNPESQSGRPEILLDRRKCTLCGLCGRLCPSGAARLDGGVLRFDRAVCTVCGRCADACPNDARSLSGTPMTTDEVLREILRDLKFYKKSGGGVTLSGGEPLAQPGFARRIFRRCKEAELRTVLDTCGHAPWAAIEPLLGDVDLVLFDIKHLDAGKHRQATGADNRRILENARKISRRTAMRIRVPLIPGFNDSPETVREIASFARDTLGDPPIDLLPYNRMGEVKYDFLDQPASPRLSQTDEHLRRLAAIVRREPFPET